MIHVSSVSGAYWNFTDPDPTITKNTDKDKDAYVNLTKNTSLFGKDFELKLGGLYRDKNRDNYYISYSCL